MKSTSRATSDAGGSSSGQLYTDYSYDSVDRMSTVTQDLVNVAYSYASGNLSLIKRSYTNGDCNQNYSFTYNRYGQRLTVSVGDRVLAAYSYDTTTHNLSDMTYGNDTEGVASYQYTYDCLDRMIGKAMPYTGEYFAYVYDYLGNVVEERYSRLGSEVRTYHFEYDRLGRPVSRYKTENGVIVLQSVQSYDSKGYDQGYTYEGDGFSYGHKYTYGENNGRLETFAHTFNGKDEFAGVIAYANLGCVRFRLYGGECSGRVSYTYQKASDDANRITSNASSHDANRRPYTGEPGSTYTAPNGDSRTYGPDGTPEQIMTMMTIEGQISILMILMGVIITIGKTALEVQHTASDGSQLQELHW